MQEKQRLWGSLTDVVLSDTIRSESVGTIKVLEALNVQPVLLTGDNEKAAASIARQLGISEIQANCLPEDKLKYINEYQNRQEAVCMIGDGINARGRIDAIQNMIKYNVPKEKILLDYTSDEYEEALNSMPVKV